MSVALERERAVKEKARAYLAARASESLGRPMPKPTHVTQTATEIPPDVKAWEEACDQVRKAKEVLDLPASAYLRYPFPSLGDIVGGVRPGRVHYYVSASNNGKTTFVRSFIEAAIAAGQSCAVMTSETTPDDFRLQIAAAALGLHVGDVSTGEIARRSDNDRIKAELTAEMERWADYEAGTHTMLRISDASGYLTAEKVRLAAREAADIGADWFLIDHVDHVEGANGMSEFQVSNAVNTAAWRAALDLDLRVLCTSQLNQDIYRQYGQLGLCMPPQESWVKYGGKKKEHGWVMLSANRQLRQFTDEEERKKELAAYKNGERTISDIALPLAHLRVMKHRDYGERVGASCKLEVRRGRLCEPTKDTAGALHGIRTSGAF